MNYQKVYDQLMFRAICRTDSPTALTGYSEKHHIVPKSMGGSNKKVNLVALTPREHYIAHHLLYKIHKNRSMAHAWFMMCHIRNNHKVTSRQAESARIANYVAGSSEETKLKISNASKGNTNMLGKKHSTETKDKMSKLATGRKHTEESKQKMRKPKSEEHKEKIYQATKDMSEETKQKIRDARKSQVMKPWTEERRQKLSESQKLAHARRKLEK